MKILFTIITILVSLSLHAEIEILNVEKATPGQCDGKITLDASGTAGPFTVKVFKEDGTQQGSTLFDVNSSIMINDLCEGLYHIEVGGVDFCEIMLTSFVPTEDIECPENDLNVEVILVECVRSFIDIDYDGSVEEIEIPGRIKIEITGGFPFPGNRYQITWSNGIHNEKEIRPEQEGIYIVNVVDATGCSISKSITIGDGADQINIRESIDVESHRNCNIPAGKEGIFKVEIDGGNPPYNIEWSNGTLDQSYINYTESGTYCVTVTDQCNSKVFCKDLNCIEDLNQECSGMSSSVYQFGRCFKNYNFIIDNIPLFTNFSGFRIAPHPSRYQGIEYLIFDGNYDHPIKILYSGTASSPQNTIIFPSKEELDVAAIKSHSVALKNAGSYNFELLSDGCVTRFTFNYTSPETRRFFVSHLLELGSYNSYPYKGTTTCNNCGENPNLFAMTRESCIDFEQNDQNVNCDYTSTYNCDPIDPGFVPFNYIPDEPSNPCAGGKLYFKSRNIANNEIVFVEVSESSGHIGINLPAGSYPDAELDCQGRPGCFFSNITSFDRPVYVAICENFTPPQEDVEVPFTGTGIVITEDDIDSGDLDACGEIIATKVDTCTFQYLCLGDGSVSERDYTDQLKRCVYEKNGSFFMVEAHCPITCEVMVEEDIQESEFLTGLASPSIGPCPCDFTTNQPLPENVSDRERKYEYPVQTKINVFPNPTFEKLNIVIQGNVQGFINYKIYDMQGKQISNHTFDNSSNATVIGEELNVANYPAGVYFVVISNQNIYEVRKFTVAK